MTDPLENAARETKRVSGHVATAAMALNDFRAAGINGEGVLMNPFVQLRHLQAARDELDKAIAIVGATTWPATPTTTLCKPML